MNHKIIHLQATPSTNDYMRNLWKTEGSLSPYTTVIADHQTGGRGRLGRSWETPKGKALLMTTAVPTTDSALSWATLIAGMVVHQTLTSLATPGTQVQLKWPNDVLLQGRKTSGILCEFLGGQGERRLVAVGVGINLTQTEEELPRPDTTSLSLEGFSVPSPTALAEVLVQGLKEAFSAANTHSGLSHLQASYRALCVTVGRRITATLDHNNQVTGVAKKITSDGALLIEDATNNTFVIRGASVAQHEPLT